MRTETSSDAESGQIVPFLGRDIMVAPSDLVYQRAAGALSAVSANVVKVASSTKPDSLWVVMAQNLTQFSQKFFDPQRPPKRYQIDILLEALVPYIEEIQTRIHTDSSRFSQLEELFSILTDGSSTGGSQSGAAYDATSTSYHDLRRIESLVKEIDRQGGLWKSKLSNNLTRAVNRQWRPIISDHQRALQQLGGRLCILGLVEAVGRPVVMLYPLFLAAKEALKIASEFEKNKKLSPQSIVQIVKMVGLLWAVMQLSGILAMYTGLGYACLVMGLAAFVVSSNDELTKLSVPMLAPNMATIAMFLDRLYSLEKVAITALSAPHETQPQTQSPAQAPSSSSFAGRPPRPTGSANTRQSSIDAASAVPVDNVSHSGTASHRSPSPDGYVVVEPGDDDDYDQNAGNGGSDGGSSGVQDGLRRRKS
jgi:hypothetical protein